MGDGATGVVTYKRWKRFGKDRLYVNRDDVQVGYLDLLAGTLHPESPELSDELTAAVDSWRLTVPEPGSDLVPELAARGRSKDTEAPLLAEPHVVGVPRESEPLLAVVAATFPQPAGGGGSKDPEASPASESVIADLAANRPGASLQAQIDAAHAAGQRATFLRRIFLGKHARSSWERGAIGERLVAAELEKLQRKDARWLFLHSIPVGSNDSDIDHVLIGPGGVFTINSKNHDGMKVWVGGNTFMVNGVRQPHIRNSRHEASRASKLLTKATGFDVSVRGVVVPVNADTFVVKAAPEDVTVINRNRLVKHLRRLPERLAQNTVEAVFEQACRSTTWLPLPGGAREHPSC